MFKAFSTTMLLGFTAANNIPGHFGWQQGVPPHGHSNCEEIPAQTTEAVGLVPDYDMGGCKCADPLAEWGPGPEVTALWACYCPDNMYNDSPYSDKDFKTDTGKVEASDDRNRQRCGVIAECVQAAVTQ